MAGEEKVQVFGFRSGSYSRRVELALKLKGVDYEHIDEDMLNNNKSDLLVKYNPIYKKVPVLVHNGKPISESRVILEYIEETWMESYAILPKDPYQRALARFWAKYIDDKGRRTSFADSGRVSLTANGCDRVADLKAAVANMGITAMDRTRTAGDLRRSWARGGGRWQKRRTKAATEPAANVVCKGMTDLKGGATNSNDSEGDVSSTRSGRKITTGGGMAGWETRLRATTET
ncbi:glutathione S-transferase U8-like [Cucumis melo var. makuwa]|uniref:Glutathione S-transferase n=1 Tax=Cucumis melo var. makuwa TaxID=1194695 RepID=A0A5D3DJQ2_CUCMM|nr:glutathione S-transferase U8-like [Cucumis melo var. makuwa]